MPNPRQLDRAIVEPRGRIWRRFRGWPACYLLVMHYHRAVSWEGGRDCGFHDPFFIHHIPRELLWGISREYNSEAQSWLLWQVIVITTQCLRFYRSKSWHWLLPLPTNLHVWNFGQSDLYSRYNVAFVPADMLGDRQKKSTFLMFASVQGYSTRKIVGKMVIPPINPAHRTWFPHASPRIFSSFSHKGKSTAHGSRFQYHTIYYPYQSLSNSLVQNVPWIKAFAAFVETHTSYTNCKIIK